MNNHLQTNHLKTDTVYAFNFSRQRELNYLTEYNKQIFYKQDDFVMQNIRAEVAIFVCPAIKTRHTFKVAYTKNNVSDTVLCLNPHYYPITCR